MTTSAHLPCVGDGFFEAVDRKSGTITAEGHLEQGADLIRGAAEALCRSGHQLIVVYLQAVQAVDGAALAQLRSLAGRIQALGSELIVLAEDRRTAS